MNSDAADSFGPVGGADQTVEESPESEQSELDLGVVSTGSPEVDRSLRPLDTIADLPVSEHAEKFDQVLVDLTETMTSSDRQDVVPAVPPAAG